MNTIQQETPPVYVRPVTYDDTIELDFHESIDPHKSIVTINGKVWNGGPIDLHEAKEFTIEFELVDHEGGQVFFEPLLVEGDRTSPAIKTNVPDQFYCTQDMELLIETDPDMDRLTIFVNGEEQTGSVFIRPENQSIRIEAADRAGNKSVHAIEVRPLAIPELTQEGRRVCWTDLPEDTVLTHNGQSVNDDHVLLGRGSNSFMLHSPRLLEPVRLQTIEYAPEPLHLHASWENDRLTFETSSEARSVEIAVNNTIYQGTGPIVWKQTGEEQILDIKAVLHDEFDNVFEQVLQIRIDALKQEEKQPAVSPIPPVLIQPVKAPVPMQAPAVIDKIPEQKREPIVRTNRSMLPNGIVLEKTITVEGKEKVDMQISEQPIDQPLQIRLKDENLLPLREGTASSKVRIVFDKIDLSPGQIESVRVNDQLLEMDQLKTDRMGQLYFEMDTVPQAYTIDVTYKDQENKARTVQSRFSLSKKEVSQPSMGWLWTGAAVPALVWITRRLRRHV